MGLLQSFSKTEFERYSRHFILPDFGPEGQIKLKDSKVLVIGSGGLGAPLLLYLTAAGVGHIGVVDFDSVELSNLQRQVLFNAEDIGRSKSETATEKLRLLNEDINLVAIKERLSSENALSILSDYDVIVDGTDNFPTRYLVNDACVLLDKPLVYGSIFRFEGQVAVFNHNGGPNYRDLFPTPPPPDMVPNCAEGGVLGVLPGIIGSLQANETIKLITGIGEVLAGKLLVFDAAYMEMRKLSVPDTGARKSITKLIDYEQFCMVDEPLAQSVPSMTVDEYSKVHGNSDVQLIDVREPYEYEISNLNGLLIPKGEVLSRLKEISKDIPVIVHCRTGKRSAEVVQQLIEEGYANVYNLEGGILKWIEEKEPNLQKY